MQLFIITGTTKGLGFSLAKKALDQGHFVLSISRESAFKSPSFINIKHDLKKTKGLEDKFQKALKKIDLKKIKAIHLINNAAMIAPIESADHFSLEQIDSHMQVNVIAPIFLTSLVLKTFKKKKCFQTFTNISSGAATKTIPAWSLYSSAKAGLRMFTESLASDYQKSENMRFLDFSPGVMDTGMQATIRKQKSKAFSRLEDFKKLKAKNLLLSADTVAMALFTLLERPEGINKIHYDVKDFTLGIS